MTRLRFIKPWSTYRPGDTMDTESPFTVERMVRTYGLCEVIDASGAAVPLPPIEPEDKAIEEPLQDKMIHAAGKAKMRKTGRSGAKTATPAPDTQKQR